LKMSLPECACTRLVKILLDYDDRNRGSRTMSTSRDDVVGVTSMNIREDPTKVRHNSVVCCVTASREDVIGVTSLNITEGTTTIEEYTTLLCCMLCNSVEG